MNNNNKEVIRQLKALIMGGNAHATLHDALANIPENKLGLVPEHLPYSIWQLAEHIRICQWDILEFSKDAKHVSPDWPVGYWPVERAPENNAAWDKCVSQIKHDCLEFIGLLEQEGADLYTPFPWGDGQNLLREAMLIADHNSYHTGEIIVIRRMLGCWK